MSFFNKKAFYLYFFSLLFIQNIWMPSVLPSWNPTKWKYADIADIIENIEWNENVQEEYKIRSDNEKKLEQEFQEIKKYIKALQKKGKKEKDLLGIIEVGGKEGKIFKNIYSQEDFFCFIESIFKKCDDNKQEQKKITAEELEENLEWIKEVLELQIEILEEKEKEAKKKKSRRTKRRNSTSSNAYIPGRFEVPNEEMEIDIEEAPQKEASQTGLSNKMLWGGGIILVVVFIGHDCIRRNKKKKKKKKGLNALFLKKSKK